MDKLFEGSMTGATESSTCKKRADHLSNATSSSLSPSVSNFFQAFKQNTEHVSISNEEILSEEQLLDNEILETPNPLN